MSLVNIKEKILTAEKKHNRAIGSTTLIAVSKVQPLERVEIALKDGHRVFGENRVQEAQAKWPLLKEQYDNVELHLIGPLQTNKTRSAISIAALALFVCRGPIKCSSTLSYCSFKRGHFD